VPLPPYPVAPNPVSWASKQVITTALLTQDMANAALLLANRPLFMGAQTLQAQSIANGPGMTLVNLDTEFVDSWNGHQIPNPTWNAPLAGVYLVEGSLEVAAFAANTTALGVGIQTAQGTTVVSSNMGGQTCGNGSTPTGVATADLVALDPATSGNVALLGECSGAAANVTGTKGGATLKAEWVGLLPTGAAPGTVVRTANPAKLWPPGAGTVITTPGGIPAGATSFQVADTTGIEEFATLGLDYLHGRQMSPGAETVFVPSTVSGHTVTISPGTLYPHAEGAPVAVPVGEQFLRLQVCDAINFLAYPPYAVMDTLGSAQSIPSQTIPAGTQISFTEAALDNFGGWNGATAYFAPFPGIYYVYGQVFMQSASGYTAVAGLSVNSGTVQWGAGPTNQSSTSRPLCATVRRHLRLNAGDNVQLFVTQNSGSSIGLSNSAGFVSKMIVVFRRF
jgi:hypothetical protein